MLKYKFSRKSFQLGPSCLQKNERTYMTKLIVAFRNFAKAPNTQTLKYMTQVLLNSNSILRAFIIFLTTF
jgi:hypothetical protein